MMPQEDEVLEVPGPKVARHGVLLAKNKELLQTIAGQARQIEALCQRIKNERQKCHWQQKHKEDLVEYYVPQFQLLLNENKELMNTLNELNRSSPILNSPSQPISCTSSTAPSSTASDGNREYDRQLELFLSDGAKFGVKSNPEILVRKLQVVKGFVMRERAKMIATMRSIKEEAKRAEIRLHYVIMEREERLTTTKKEFEDEKALINTVSSKLSLQVERLQADLYKEKKENLRLRNSCQTTGTTITCLDSGDVIYTGEPTSSASESVSNDLAEDCDVANTFSIPTTYTTNSAVDSTPSVTSTSSTVTPLFESTINYGKSPNSSNEKRKTNPSNGVEVSRKLKTRKVLFDRSSRDHESVKDSETSSKPRIMELERVVSEQNIDLTEVLAYNVKLQKALTKINIDKNYISEREKDVFPYTGMDQAPRCTTTKKTVTRSPPVSPITREDAKFFASVEEYQFATFSEMHYRYAFKSSSFLVHKPIGINNPGGTFCYMNSVVQALSSIPVFAVSVVCGLESEEGSLLHALYQIYKHVWVRRPDAWNNNRPTSLNTKEIRRYYAKNHGVMFDPKREHDAQEFLEDLISNLERETSKYYEYAEQNCITLMFRGYIIAPDGTKEYFRNLRLSLEDERIDSVESALLYHLANWSPRPPPRDVPESRNFSATSTAKVDQIGHLQRPNIIVTGPNVKPTSRDGVETASTCKETVDCAPHQNADSVRDCRSFYTRIKEKSTKIYTPDILCVSLNRHKIDYSFNYKVLPAEDLVIPADLRAPEGTKIPAYYKLMSIIQYVPMGRTAGHYYTFLMSGKGIASMLNDSFLTSVEMNKNYLTALEGLSSIFIYAKEPAHLRRSSGSN